MDQIDVIAVPFNSSGTEDGVAGMPYALAGAGLYDVLGQYGNVNRRHVTFETPEPVRGPSGLLAEPALVSMVVTLSNAVAEALRIGSWPVVVGGDCSVLLGVLLGVRLAGFDGGLMFVDGHEDAWPPELSPTGETADSELGIALGWHPAPKPLVKNVPLIEADQVVVIGPRDQTELTKAGVTSIAERVQMVSALDLVDQDMIDVGSNSAMRLRQKTGRWWLHIDLDVLSTDAFSAVDYPQPGGLSWNQLEDLVAAALNRGGCIGASTVIYNPDLDASAGAHRIVTFVGHLTGLRQRGHSSG